MPPPSSLASFELSAIPPPTRSPYYGSNYRSYSYGSTSEAAAPAGPEAAEAAGGADDVTSGKTPKPTSMIVLLQKESETYYSLGLVVRAIVPDTTSKFADVHAAVHTALRYG